jgi:DNA-directed RNA polymerase subunit H (RpoH/RPB5)
MWQIREIKECTKFFIKHRKPNLEVINLSLASDVPLREMVAKVKEVVPPPENNFILILHYSPIKIRELITGLGDPRYYCKIFFWNELLICPMDNILVPVHEKCKNVSQILSMYSISLEQLPKIPLSDPIVRWNGWGVGDVINIYRENEIYYRIVNNV